jgi:hypothetical protein
MQLCHPDQGKCLWLQKDLDKIGIDFERTSPCLELPADRLTPANANVF